MTLPSTGSISMSQVNVELGRSATANLTMNDSALRALAGKPSGTVALSDLRGKTQNTAPTISAAKTYDSSTDIITLTLGGIPYPTTSMAWVSGGLNVEYTKNSETQYTFFKNLSGAGSGTARFYATNSVGQAFADMAITVSGGGASCFVQGSMVTMADGTYKDIALIEAGEWIKTATGIAQVTGVEYPVLGDRALYAFDDGKCITSAEHSVWSRSPVTGLEWWATRDMDQWRYEAETGQGPSFDEEPYNLTDCEGIIWDFATEKGWSRTTWFRVEAPFDTVLYHLKLNTGGSYYVDGYLVSSMASEGGVDWDKYKHEVQA